MQAHRVAHAEHDTPPCRRQLHAGQQGRERSGGIIVAATVGRHEPPSLDDQSATAEAVDSDTRPAAAAHGPGQFHGVAHIEPHDRVRGRGRRSRTKQLPHAGRDGQPELRAAPKPCMAGWHMHHLDRAGGVIPESPGLHARPGKCGCPIGQRPCGREAINRCWPLACHAEMHAGPIDHHTDAAIGTDVGHPKRQHAQV